MAITVKYLEDLGVEKEVAEKIFAERSKEIEADKAKREKLETELKESKDSLESLTTEIDTLKTSGKNAEEIQAKLDALIAEREAEKTKAEADRLAKEKADNVLSRFNAVKKKFKHNDIEQAYLKRFSDAIESKDFEGKSDTEIYHELTKDDDCHEGVKAVHLAGGTPSGVGGKSVTREDFNKMSYKERLQIYNENQALYNELTT